MEAKSGISENKTKPIPVVTLLSAMCCRTCEQFNACGLDEPDDPAFCGLDGRTVGMLTVCEKWVINQSLDGKIQLCEKGHEYFANSHEYPCSVCKLR